MMLGCDSSAMIHGNGCLNKMHEQAKPDEQPMQCWKLSQNLQGSCTS